MVTVQSGETLVMAGLIKEENSRSSDGLPWLSELPLLGGLFGKQTTSDNRTELIILITPKVMQTVKQAAEVTAEYRRRMSGLEGLLKSIDAPIDQLRESNADERGNKAAVPQTLWQPLPPTRMEPVESPRIQGLERPVSAPVK
jgi:type II secretory pathway component GspD/PulD (secretin)